MAHGLRKMLIYILCIIILPSIVTLMWTGVLRGEAVDIDYNKPRVVVNQKRGDLEMNLDEYMVGVLAAGLEYCDEVEYIKAQAVMARTGIMAVMGGERVVNSESLGFNYLSAGERKRLWREECADREQLIRDCISAVDSQVMYYGDMLISCPYGLLSAGQTRTGGEAYPWLVSVSCSGDAEAEGFVQIRQLEASKLAAMFREHYQREIGLNEAGIRESIQVVSRDSAGYITKIQVGTEVMTGDEFAGLLGLASAHFSLDYGDDGYVTITVKGDGGGYGMSLYTARAMAWEGKTYDEILKYFYYGIEIKT